MGIWLRKGESMYCATSKTLSNTNKTGIKGVHYDKNIGKYKAERWFLGKRYSLGLHENLDDAIEARKLGEEKSNEEFLAWYNEVKPNLRKKFNGQWLTKTQIAYLRGKEYLDEVNRISTMRIEDNDKDAEISSTKKNVSLKEIIESREICDNYLSTISNQYGMTRKEYLVKLVRQDMLVHPDIIERIGDVVIV